MEAMVGFRNIAIHNYQALDPEIMKAILQERLPDLEDFSAAIPRVEDVRATGWDLTIGNCPPFMQTMIK